MSDEGFLRRWSRRKQSAATPQTPEAAPDAPPEGGTEQPAAATTPPAEEEAIDPATLPPIDSLGADSDYTVFLKKGVPEALRIAALRKAWITDPLIRDFRHPAEYAWDFTTPEFNLRPSDDVAKMLDQVFAPDRAKQTLDPQAARAEPKDEPAPTAAAPEPAPQIPPKLLPEDRRVAAPTSKSAPDRQLSRRRHGGAAPK